ncbi:hypothetical protein OIO90_004516 [Microbotryomycetes sp. JL221]|nr:hypothetical protein OIO90_004516 [Microbotryomycetes sp. JL221]
MPPPSTAFAGRTQSGFDVATLSDDDDDDASSSSSLANATTLGFVDGAIDPSSTDLTDWKLSRIGGMPCFPPLSTVPCPSSALCLNCSTSMPLLTQIYCPLEHSQLERVLYVFACTRKQCQARTGSVRAWRASQLWHNPPPPQQSPLPAVETDTRRPALDLGNLVFGTRAATTTDVVANKAGSIDSSTKKSDYVNQTSPFDPPSSSSSCHVPNDVSSLNPFALPTTSASGLNPFAPVATTPPHSVDTSPTSQSPLSTSIHHETSQPATHHKLHHTWLTNDESKWFKPQYITTAYEEDSTKPLEQKLMSNLLLQTKLDDNDDDDDDDGPIDGKTFKPGKASGGRVKKGANRASSSSSSQIDSSRKPTTAGTSGGEWSKEGYEVQQIKGVDEVFLNFQQKVSLEPNQIVRYHHGSTPLAFSSNSKPYKTLFTSSSTLISSKINSKTNQTFNSNQIQTCSSCHSRRIFELQLMPNLIWSLGLIQIQSSQQQEQLERIETHLEWSTIWICTCENECTQMNQKEKKGEAWREEMVYVEIEQ